MFDGNREINCFQEEERTPGSCPCSQCKPWLHHGQRSPFLGCLLELSAFHPEAVKTSSGCAKSTATGEIYLDEGWEVSL